MAIGLRNTMGRRWALDLKIKIKRRKYFSELKVNYFSELKVNFRRNNIFSFTTYHALRSVLRKLVSDKY
jgi:hypothetical protein